MIINEKLKKIWHGGDYNPDQWLDSPEILQKDIELMKKADCNVMSIGIFSWSALEPEEGKFNFQWLDSVIDNLYKNGIYTVLATPSGSRPSWMAKKYPEVLRTDYHGIRYSFGERHNHCPSSPVYREKVRIINTELAKRYAHHPGVVMWHVSNEYSADGCFCEKCRSKFRGWLKNKYGTIENLNKKWWNGFWSHNYSDWSEIDPPNPLGENGSSILKLEWRRFNSELVIDFYSEETKPLRAENPDIPITTNFTEITDIDYDAFAEKVDFVSWDNYPLWHSPEDTYKTAVRTAARHSMFSGFKPDRPFMMMESSPSATNWQGVAKLRRPGMHSLSSIQAVAHGSDTVQYFQWRKSRGQSEKFHGAVVGHDGGSDTRVFSDVKNIGKELKKLSEIIGSVPHNEAAIIFDFENLWALKYAQGYRNIDSDKGLMQCVLKHFEALWSLNAGTDIISSKADFSKYKLIIAPMLYMFPDGLKEKIEKFTATGGVFAATYISAVEDENDLCWAGEDFYPLRDVLGVHFEETDALYDSDSNKVEMFGDIYGCKNYCELSKITDARSLGTYMEDFYAGMPAVTVNQFGKGNAYYIAADIEQKGLKRLYEEMLSDAGISHMNTPCGVNIQTRRSNEDIFTFIMNFNALPQKVNIDFGGELIAGSYADNTIEGYGFAVFKKPL